MCYTCVDATNGPICRCLAHYGCKLANYMQLNWILYYSIQAYNRHSFSVRLQPESLNKQSCLTWCDETKKAHPLAVMRLSLKLTCCVSCQVMSTANWLPCIARSPRHPSTAAFSFPPAARLCTLSCSAAPCSCCRCAASCPWSSSSVPVQTGRSWSTMLQLWSQSTSISCVHRKPDRYWQ